MMYTRDIRWIDRILANSLIRVLETTFQDDKEKKYVSVENHRFQELDGRGICGLHSIEGNKPDSF